MNDKCTASCCSVLHCHGLVPCVICHRLVLHNLQVQVMLPTSQGRCSKLPPAVAAHFCWVCRLLQSPDVPTSLKQQLSPALAELLRAMVTDTLAVEDPMSPGWLKTSCHLLLRALTRTLEFARNSALPLMPADAEQLLQWAVQRLTPPGSRAGSAGGGSSQELGTGVLPPMLLQDDKLYLVLAKLVATAYGERGSSHAPSQGSSSTSSYSVRKGLLQHNPQLMGQLLSWSSSLVKRSLDDFMQSTGECCPMAVLVPLSSLVEAAHLAARLAGLFSTVSHTWHTALPAVDSSHVTTSCLSPACAFLFAVGRALALSQCQ